MIIVCPKYNQPHTSPSLSFFALVRCFVRVWLGTEERKRKNQNVRRYSKRHARWERYQQVVMVRSSGRERGDTKSVVWCVCLRLSVCACICGDWEREWMPLGCLKLIFSGTIIVILPSTYLVSFLSYTHVFQHIRTKKTLAPFTRLYVNREIGSMSLETEVQWDENER